MNTLIAIAALLVIPLENQWTKLGHSIEDRDPLGVGFHLILLFLTAATCGLAFLACKYWGYLLIPAGLVGLICYYAKKKPREVPVLITPPVESIEKVRARAEKTYPILKQAAYLLFTDLCRYLPGLVSLFSLSAVTAPVRFDITASLVTQFHFVIAKGHCDAPVDTVKEILDNIPFSHLRLACRCYNIIMSCPYKFYFCLGELSLCFTAQPIHLTVESL